MPEYANKKYEPEQKVVQVLKGGLDASKPPSDIDETNASDINNLQFFRGKLRVDTGYKQFRQTVLLGVPMGQFQFITTEGALSTLLLTTKTLYKDNSLNWEYVGDKVRSTTLKAGTGAGSNVFTVQNVSPAWAIGQEIGIRLSDGSQLQSTLTQIGPSNSIQTADDVPPGLMAPSGGDVVGPPSFNGTFSIQPIGITWPITNWFIFTNGVDTPWKYDGTNVQPLGGSPPVCRTLGEFHGFLILGNTEDGQGSHPQRLQNSDLDNPEEWVKGLSGFVDLVDTEDQVLDMDQLGPWLIIYRHTSVMRRSYIGDLNQLFFDEYTLQGVGVETTGCVAPTGNSHFFFGDQGFFMYQGGYDVESVGEKIFDSVFGVSGDFNDVLSAQSFCFYVAELDEVWIFYPTTSSKGFCDKLLRFNPGDDSWHIRHFADEVVGFGFIEATGGRTWLEATEAWQDDTLPWNARANTEQSPQTILCDAVNTRTLLYDYNQPNDAGVPISWKYDTKDFISPPYLLRLDGFSVRGTGNNVLIQCSTDTGDTWETLGTVDFGLTFTTQKVTKQVVADQIRFRLSGTDPNFSMDWYRIEFFQETPW